MLQVSSSVQQQGTGMSPTFFLAKCATLCQSETASKLEWLVSPPPSPPAPSETIDIEDDDDLSVRPRSGGCMALTIQLHWVHLCRSNPSARNCSWRLC